MLGESVGICSCHQTERDYSVEQVRIGTVFAERASIAIDDYQLYLREVGFKEHLEQEVADPTSPHCAGGPITALETRAMRRGYGRVPGRSGTQIQPPKHRMRPPS